MKMIRRLLYMLPCMLVLLATGIVLLAETPSALPPLTVDSDMLTLNMKKTPRTLLYEGNVRCQSPQYQTLITCQRMEANAAALKAANTVTASGDVVFSMTVTSKETGKPTYKLNGTTQLMVYTIQGGDPVIIMKKDKGVLPSLIITDLTTKEKSELRNSGEVMEYNLNEEKLVIQKAHTTSEGSGQ